MIPTPKLNPKGNPNKVLIGSRSYTFMETYMYMRNHRYSAVFEKNKEILELERQAVETESADILYKAFIEQVRILDSIVIRIRNFTLTSRQKILANIRTSAPSSHELKEFDSALASINGIDKFKYIKYQVPIIKYSNMNQFYNAYKIELKAMFDTVDEGHKAFTRDVATKFLKSVANTNAVSSSLLEMERIGIMDMTKLQSVKRFFVQYGKIISIINTDFKLFQFYLRQYRFLPKLVDDMQPEYVDSNKIQLKGVPGKSTISFNEYIVIYKHYSSMIKYMFDMINDYDRLFFNKIYAIQSNIELNKAIINMIVNKNNETLNEFADTYSLINGNDAAHTLLMDAVDEDSDNAVHEEDDIDAFLDTVDDSMLAHAKQYLASDLSDIDLGINTITTGEDNV